MNQMGVVRLDALTKEVYRSSAHPALWNPTFTENARPSETTKAGFGRQKSHDSGVQSWL